MATHSSTHAWKIPWTEEPGRLQTWDRKESDMTERLHKTEQLHIHFPGVLISISLMTCTNSFYMMWNTFSYDCYLYTFLSEVSVKDFGPF